MNTNFVEKENIANRERVLGSVYYFHIGRWQKIKRV